MRKKNLRYIADCVSARARDIKEMVDNAREITYETFIKYVDYKLLNEMFGNGNLSIKNDYHVRYFKGKYKGKRVYYIVHSAIEYIFGE